MAQGGELILRLNVRSWAEREGAERAAGPQRRDLGNRIVVNVDDTASGSD